MMISNMLREIDRRERRAYRALNRLLLATLLICCLTLGAVPLAAASSGNPWTLLLIIPGVLVPLGFQELGIRRIDRKYGLR